MPEEKRKYNLQNVIIGIIMIILDSLWLYIVSMRFYGQNYTGILYFYMYPNWFLILGCICSIIGIILGICIIRKQIAIKYGLIVNIILFVICLVLSFYITN